MKLTPLRVLLAGWAVFLLYGYPGYMQTDSANLLVDAGYGTISDWYSPMLALVWRVAEWFIGGPALMLMLQGGLLVGGSYHVLRRLTSDLRAAWLSVGVLLFPAVLVTGALVSPEAMLAGLLASAMAALASERRWVRLAGLGLVVLATGMVEGASVVALPIVVAQFRWGEEAGWRRRAIALGAWLGCVALSLGVVALLVDHRSDRLPLMRAQFDTIHTLCRAPAMSDTEVRAVFADAPLAPIPDIQRRACEIKHRGAQYANGEQRVFDEPRTSEAREALVHARFALAREAPAAFFAHRWNVFARAIGLRGPQPLYTKFLEDPDHGDSVGHRASSSRLQRLLVFPVKWLAAHTPLVRPFVYLLLALVIVPLALLMRARLAMVLVASGLGSAVVLLVNTYSAQPRESHWLIVATTLAIATLMAARFWPVSGKTPS